MLADSKKITISLKETKGDAFQNERMSTLISFLEQIIDMSIRVISEKARNDFVIKTYNVLFDTVEVHIRANEQNIMTYLEQKEFNFNQYDDKSSVIESFFNKTFKIWFRTKEAVKHKVEDQENRLLVVRTLANLFIEQLEEILHSNIKMAHERYHMPQ